MPHFDRKLRRMSSLLRIASDKESAHDAGQERRKGKANDETRLFVVRSHGGFCNVLVVPSTRVGS
jgi:hypothetical protein